MKMIDRSGKEWDVEERHEFNPSSVAEGMRILEEALKRAVADSLISELRK